MEVASVVFSASISSMPCAAILSDADSSDDWMRISRHSDDSAAISSSSLDGCAEPRRLGGGAGGAASKVALDVSEEAPSDAFIGECGDGDGIVVGCAAVALR